MEILLPLNFHQYLEIAVTLIKSSSSSVILAVVVAVVLGYFYRPYWAVRNVPGPPAMPLIGHLHLMAKYGPDLFPVLAKRYGPIFRFHMGRQPLVIVANAELCKEVGMKKFKYFPNRSMPAPISAFPVHQKGLFFTRDLRWSTMRNAVLSVYQPSYLAKLVPVMQDFIESATQNLDSKGDFTISDLALKLATDITGQAAFGVDFGLSKPKKRGHNEPNIDNNRKEDDQAQKFINQHIYATTQLKMDLSGSLSIIMGLLFPILQEPFRRILMRIPGTMDWKIHQTNQTLTNQLDEIVASRMKVNDHSNKDFMSLVLSASESEADSKSNFFTPDYVSALAYENMLAGSTTTSFTLSAVIYLVAMHPDVERKLLEEIDAFGPHDKIPNAHDLQHNFPYVEQVIKEALRFYTTSPLVAREASAEVNIGGYVIPKGTWVWLAIGVLHKDPENFPEPDKFIPERFDPNCDEEKRRHPYANIPFGIGPRACIGQKFSMQEIKLAMIHLYRKYVFLHSPKMENPLEFGYGIIVNFKHGVKVQAIKRTLC